jgi:hypothetical protein
MQQAIHAAARSFGHVFARQMVWSESLEQLLSFPDRRIVGSKI